jgi:hypothetical protein
MEEAAPHSVAGAAMIVAQNIAAALGGRRSGGEWVCRCPAHEDRRPSLAVRDGDDRRVLLHCHAGCNPLDVIDALKALGLWDGQEQTFTPSKPKPKAVPTADNRGKARGLWRRSLPIQRTVAETYLRRERGISCPLPATLRFLPGTDRHPPSMIAAFGFAAEPASGVLSISENDVVAVHLTKLTPDGRKHPDEPNKIMLGSAPGVPIVVAPVNDVLGLSITEGVEDALSVHEETGLGAWAAGSAGRMPTLAEAVPDWCDCVTIFEDANAAGERSSALLADALDARNIAVEILSLNQVTL